MSAVPPLKFLSEKVSEVRTILDIATKLVPPEARAEGAECSQEEMLLRKSAVVFMAAAWEAFIEEVASQAVDHWVENSHASDSVPNHLRRRICIGLKKENHELSPWQLAGEGWKAEVQKQRDELLKKIRGFHSPKSGKINELFKDLLGISNICAHWGADEASAKKNRNQIDTFMELRGAIAHGTPSDVEWDHVAEPFNAMVTAAKSMVNVVAAHLKTTVGSEPWQTTTAD